MSETSSGIGGDPWGLALLWLIVAVPTALACLLGRAAYGRPRRGVKALALSAAAALVLAAIALLGRDPDVPAGDLAIGVALAAVGVGALPVAVCFALGLLVRPRWLAAVLWFVLTLPLMAYALIGWLIVEAYVYCPPGANDCPV